MTAQKKRPLSKTAQSRSARLMAVQTLYGVFHTDNDMKEAIADTLVKAEHMKIDGEEIVPPNKILFQKFSTVLMTARMMWSILLRVH